MLEVGEGLTILVDKPYTWTSFDAVNKLRWNLKRQLKVKKIKVGHAGTLDPLATGLLVICIGKHTKLIEGLTNDHKTYTGTFLLGKTTPSYDLETEIDEKYPITHIDEGLIHETVKQFLGEIDQKPPVATQFKPAFGRKIGAFDPKRLFKVFFLMLYFGLKLRRVDLINPCPHQFPIVSSPRNFLHSLGP